MNDKKGIIRNRKLIPCPTTTDWSIPELLEACPFCGDFLFHCCTCRNKYGDRRYRRITPCHQYRVVFTDGACTNNGKPTAKAGVGVAYGSSEDSQMSKPITDIEDSFSVRSNQRAELWAAKLGLEFLAAASFQHYETPKDGDGWIIATDSEYVVKGMTEWLPRWRENNWCTSKGTIPVNLDLFLALDGVMRQHEEKNIKIGLWHIPREHNKLADGLAKAAAAQGDEARRHDSPMTGV